MKTDLVKPCADCPFRRDGDGIKLYRERVESIHDGVARGFAFLCHKTVKHRDEDEENEDDERAAELRQRDPNEQHCAGAAAYALNVVDDDIARLVIEIRFSSIDDEKLTAIRRSQPEVWPSLDAWKKGGVLP